MTNFHVSSKFESLVAMAVQWKITRQIKHLYCTRISWKCQFYYNVLDFENWETTVRV